MLNISVLTPDKEIFHGNIKSVKVPGTLGQFQVLNNHAPIVSSLDEGVVYIVTAGSEYRYFDEETNTIKVGNETGRTITFKTSGGFIEVLNNEVSLLVKGVRNVR